MLLTDIVNMFSTFTKTRVSELRINNVAVVGVGVVGGAILKSFQERGINAIGYDKYKSEYQPLSDIFNCDIVFLCLPTPYSEQLKRYDTQAIEDICQQLHDNLFNGLVVIKSTVEPQTTDKLIEKYNLSIIHNPEFLNARTAKEDFDNQTHLVIGIPNKINFEYQEQLVKFYREYYPSIKYVSVASATESETMKIAVNSFYAVKVQFFNELYQLCQNMDYHTDYENVKDMMLKNDWINPMHTKVPGTDGKLSYGGMCLPKDSSALLEFMKRNNCPHAVLAGTVEERNTMRDD